MTIEITSVSPSTRKPGAYLDINTRAAKLGLPVTAVRVLLVGVMTSAGTATPLELVQVFSAADAREYFGSGSPLAVMVEAFIGQNPYVSELWCIAQEEEGAGTAAAGTIEFTASSVTAGTLTVWVGSRRVRVAVAAGDSANAIAAAVEAALDDQVNLPFTASVATDTVTVTAKVKGTSGNKWVLYTEFTGTGLTAAITQPTGGATDPDIADALAVAYPLLWDIVVAGYSNADNLAALKDHLDEVAGPLEQRPGVGIAGVTGTLGTNTTLASAVNSGRISVFYLRGTRTHPIELAAMAAGAVAAEPDLARPLNFVELTDALPPDDPADLLSRTEQESCLANGLAPLMVGPGNRVQIVRTVTTYVQDSFGSADDTLLDLQTIRVLDYVRYAVRTIVQAKLGRSKIASNAVTPNTTDPTKIKSLILGVLLQLQNSLGYLERVEDWKDRLVVERDESVPTRVNATIPADIVDGLHVFAGSIDLILG